MVCLGFVLKLLNKLALHAPHACCDSTHLYTDERYTEYFSAQTRIKKIADKTCATNPRKNAAK